MIKRARRSGRQAIWTEVPPGHRWDGSQHLNNGERKWKRRIRKMEGRLSDSPIIPTSLCSLVYCRDQRKVKQRDFKAFFFKK